MPGRRSRDPRRRPAQAAPLAPPVAQDLPAQAQLVAVPLRLALTDHPDDEASNALLYEGAPWSVRLAAKLLREAALGPQSAWWPYLQVHAVLRCAALCCAALRCALGACSCLWPALGMAAARRG
jgi:hypothetical protein